MDALRAAVDAMEIIVEREAWPVPTYNEILFSMLKLEAFGF